MSALTRSGAKGKGHVPKNAGRRSSGTSPGALPSHSPGQGDMTIEEKFAEMRRILGEQFGAAPNTPPPAMDNGQNTQMFIVIGNSSVPKAESSRHAELA